MLYYFEALQLFILLKENNEKKCFFVVVVFIDVFPYLGMLAVCCCCRWSARPLMSRRPEVRAEEWSWISASSWLTSPRQLDRRSAHNRFCFNPDFNNLDNRFVNSRPDIAQGSWIDYHSKQCSCKRRPYTSLNIRIHECST